jgi:hypothetical protein
MLRCRLLGHRFRFTSDGETLRWDCARGCGAGGAKRYPDAERAATMARGLGRDEDHDLGRNSPLGLFPLRLMRVVRRRRHEG